MKQILAALLVGSALFAAPAAAQDEKGDVQVKVLGTAVLPDGNITAVNTDIINLPANLQTEANDNYGSRSYVSPAWPRVPGMDRHDPGRRGFPRAEHQSG